MLHQNVVAQGRRIALVLQNRRVNLAVLLQPGMARKAKEGQERDGETEERRRQVQERPLHFAGVLSSCCFAQTRAGFSSSDLANALRASASRLSRSEERRVGKECRSR